ncbi:MAG TPA: alpha/beta hydrolase [Actinoallomurus sp.]|jgi:pimeloyl-ACP methyl ester carboxylesterase|nr:alpha/beta hydrolase [Actinoallomurus sp.]
MADGSTKDQIGRFRSEKAQGKFFAAYDRAFDRLWEAPCEVLDVDTRFGPTRVYRHVPVDTGAEPLVLLPGTGGNALMWYSHIRALGEQRSVYAVDTIGEAGRSVQQAPLRDGRDGSVWLCDLLDGLAVRRAHLVGCSYGGWLALHHAIGAPTRTATLCLLDPAGFSTPGVRFFGWMIASAIAGLAPARLRRHAARLLHNGTLNEDELLRLTLAGTSFRRRLPPTDVLSDDQLRALTLPVLLLLGEHSTLHDPAAVAARAEAFMPDVRHETISGSGHALPLERPGLIDARISEFTGAHRAGG